MNERLDKQMDFIREIDKEKFITRMTKLTDGNVGKMMQNTHGIWQL